MIAASLTAGTDRAFARTGRRLLRKLRRVAFAVLDVLAEDGEVVAEVELVLRSFVVWRDFSADS
jgi:hypothetical protein